MEENLLSICIPCYGRVEFVRKTLQSIYNDNNDVNINNFEVVISDNDPDGRVGDLITEFNYMNLKYYHIKCEGFMNSYYALNHGTGKLLLLHNSQTMFKKGSLKLIINDIKTYTNSPLIFFTNGLIGKLKKIEYDNYEQYMYQLSYWSSWSDGFSIWKSNFEKIGKIQLNKLFPQTSLFLTQYNSKKFIIDDRAIFNGQRVPKRGGHNKFEAFTIEYPSLIEQSYLNGNISDKCKSHILKNILYDFLPQLYFNKYIIRTETFDSIGFKENLKKYFPKYAYYIIVILSIFQPLKIMKRKLLRLSK